MTQPTEGPPPAADAGASPTAEISLGTRLLMTSLPVLTTAAALGFVGLQHGWPVAGKLVGVMVAIFTVLGKFAVFGGAAAQAVGPEATAMLADLAAVVGRTPDDPLLAYVIAGLITYMDICTAMLVAYNLDWLYRLPWVGDKLRGMAASSGEIMRAFPWIGRTTFLGCMLFVAFPVSGTGAIGGTLLGKLMGFTTRRTMSAIALGAVCGAFGLAMAAQQASANIQVLMGNKLLGLGVLAAFLAFFGWLNWVVQAKVKALRAEREALSQRTVEDLAGKQTATRAEDATRE